MATSEYQSPALQWRKTTFGPTKWWDRNVAHFPYRAEVPLGTVTSISRPIHPCLVINLQRVGEPDRQKWAFTKRSHRDQFVAAWKHVGARNA